MKSFLSMAVVSLLLLGTLSTAFASGDGADYSPQGSGNLMVLIKSGNAEDIFFGLLWADRAIKNEWMDNVKVVLWGPAQKTLAEMPADSEQIKLLKGIIARGGKSGRIWACKACADRYGVAPKMEQLGCEVFHVGNAVSYLFKLGYRMVSW
ncbi:MAG: DsrE family protein [Desulfovibrionaceae bacterium]|nr:DsrE family protein [Desulfovibrionaceae bacterium]